MFRTYLRILGALLAVLAFWNAGGEAHAATDVVLSWRTTAYAPSDFKGKIFPTSNSYLTASLLVLENGKPANLSNREVRWYLDDELVRSGLGVDSVQFRAPATLGVMEVRAEVPDLDVLKTVEVPILAPKAVIRSPYERSFSVPSPVFKARPFFYNAVSMKDLVINWKANGNIPSDTSEPEELKVDILPGTPANFSLSLELVIRNPKNILEVGKGVLHLNYLPL